MIFELIGDFLIFFGIVLIAFLIKKQKSIKHLNVFLLFIAIGFIDNLFQIITIYNPSFQIIESKTIVNQYLNWSGKLYSIVFAFVISLVLKDTLSLSEIGLTLKQNKNSIRFSLISSLLFLIISGLALFSKKLEFNLEVLLFLALMPGLNEELIYRGLLLSLLNKIFKRKFKVFNTSFGWGAILTSIAFGLLHGFQLSENFHIDFNLTTTVLTGIYGFIFALIKERSGSLLFPILAHSTADFFAFFFRMV